MRHFTALVFVLLFQQLTAAELSQPEALDLLYSGDYDERQEARDALEDMLAEVTNPGSDIDRLAQFESALLERLAQHGDNLQSDVFITRLLQRCATVQSSDALFAVATDPDVDPELRDHCIQALSTITDESINDLLLRGLNDGLEADRESWWQAVGYHGNPTLVRKILRAVNSGKLELTSAAILSLSKLESPEVSEFLIGEWSEAEGSRKTELEWAIFNSGHVPNAQLVQLVQSGSSEPVRIGAFELLLEANQETALNLLQEKLQNEIPDQDRPGFLHAALNGNTPEVWNLVMESFDSLQLPEKTMVIAAIGEHDRTGSESFVTKFIGEEHDSALRMAALETLMEIGSASSIPVLSEYIDTEPEEVRELVWRTLARIPDEELDSRLLRLARDPDEPTRAEVIRLLAIRNSEGAVETLNELLQEEPSGNYTEDILDALEKIGDMESASRITMLILQEPDSPEVRTRQIALKRLALRLADPDFLWEQLFTPALKLAPTVESKARMVEILDALSSDDALEYCLEILDEKEVDPFLERAVSIAFQRWSNINIAEHWLKVATDRDSSDAEVSQAVRALSRVFDEDLVDANSRQRANLAFEAMLEIKDEVHRKTLMKAFLEGEDRDEDLQELLDPYLEIQELLEENTSGDTDSSAD